MCLFLCLEGGLEDDALVSIVRNFLMMGKDLFTAQVSLPFFLQVIEQTVTYNR